MKAVSEQYKGPKYVWVADERIQSTVSDSRVTLEGTVNLLREREDGERAVRRLAALGEA